MRHPISLAVALLALGCEGHLIDRNLPGGNPPPTTNAAFAFRFGGPGSDLIEDVATDPGGAVYVAGTFTATPDFDPGSGTVALSSLGTTDGFLAKYSAAGALVWVAQVGGVAAETVTSLARDSSGNLYLGGGFSGSTDFDPSTGLQVLTSVGGQDGYVAKYSSTGSLLWARRFGGAGTDEVNDLAVDAAGNVYAGGVFSGQADALPIAGPTILAAGSAPDGFLFSLDAGGAVRWALPIGGLQDDAVSAVVATGAGNLTVAGGFRGSADFARNSTPFNLAAQGGADGFLASYSSSGVLQWAKGIGGLSEESVPTGGLALDGQGGTALLGQFSGSADFDPGPGNASKTSISAADLFLARYDANGSFLSVVTLGGQGSILGVRALVDPDGSVLLTGWFTGSLDFDPGTTVTSLASLGQAGATDAFVARYSQSGSFAWVTRFGEVTTVGDRSNSGTALGLDPAGNVVVAGRFFGSPDFDPGSSALALSSLGEADAFLVKLTAAGALLTTP
ncbi:MAG TPA: SBBP repeat-containing protein [Gemmatimonadales bacterium]|nr:SBBP repeat-containing protein [Gemmatimonadales bacterium]